MLYYIFRFLEQFDIPGSHLWSYISFRALAALIVSLLLSAWFGERFIKWMKRRNISETARDVEIDPFGVQKKGVPTMGGIIIIVCILVPVLLLGRLRNIYLILMIVTTVWLGFLGFMDDYIKIFRHDKQGLKGVYKIVGQVSIGFIVGLTLYLSPDALVRENVSVPATPRVAVAAAAAGSDSSGGADVARLTVKHKTEAVKSLKTTIPFIKNHNLDYSSLMSFCGRHKVAFGWGLFVVMTILVVTAVSNGANLNDGMDGMCAGNAAIIGVALGILAYVSSHIGYASYFDIMYIPRSEELVVFLCAFVGAMIGFLWYNAYPAQVFMGDTGSLTIGGIIGVTAVILHKELLLPILCGIFFVESLSVIIQTQWFKLQKRRGRRVRVFRSTPIHDTFRRLDSQLDPTSTYLLKGWPHRPFHESKITVRFWITTIILAALTLITLKIR
ncbi:MAG: phospho-N-acetylmuramoyl-pentapeptide-transferase [Prevotella sp.]|nr:phospho-N-acetylmuramoyl-pentapeptide-transferase [Prevotella sp.]